jgi:flagellar protein FliL
MGIASPREFESGPLYMTDQADAALEDDEAGAADEEGDSSDGAEGASSGGKFGKKKLILFAAIGLVVLLGAGAGVYFSGLLGGGGGHEKEAAAEGGENAPPVTAHYLDLDEMVITLGGVGRKSSFLKMRLSLELASPEDEIRIKAIMPRIIDNFQVFLRELRIEELQGSQGLYRVKEELLARVNAASYPTKVRDVLFREMLVQ